MKPPCPTQVGADARPAENFDRIRTAAIDDVAVLAKRAAHETLVAHKVRVARGHLRERGSSKRLAPSSFRHATDAVSSTLAIIGASPRITDSDDDDYPGAVSQVAPQGSYPGASCRVLQRAASDAGAPPLLGDLRAEGEGPDSRRLEVSSTGPFKLVPLEVRPAADRAH